MNDFLRRKISLFAERVDGKDISIMKEVRIDNCIEELGEVTADQLCEVIAQVLSCSVDQVKAKLAEYEDSDRVLQDLVKRH